MRRIGRTDITWPNVGEFKYVSMAEYWTVLNTLFASSWMERPLVCPKLKFFVTPKFATDVPGPMMMLRP